MVKKDAAAAECWIDGFNNGICSEYCNLPRRYVFNFFSSATLTALPLLALISNKQVGAVLHRDRGSVNHKFVNEIERGVKVQAAFYPPKHKALSPKNIIELISMTDFCPQ